MKNLKRTLSLVLCLALLLGLLPNSLTVFAAEDTRDVINEVNITMPGLSDMPVDGAVVADPTYTVSPNYIDVQYANWRIKSGSTWGVTGSRFTEGTYRYQFTLALTNAQANIFRFADNLVVKVNGVPCGFLETGNTSGGTIASGYVTDNGTKVVVCTPEYTAVPGPLVFVDDPALDISEHVAGTGKYTSKSFEVYGGTKPYTFSKVSGPEWITVAADGGTIGGVPTVVGSNSDLVVRVTDSSNPAQSQEITIHVGDTKPGVGAVTITNPISELQKPGSHQYNATVVTYGAGDEIIWSLAGGTDSTISASGLLTVGVNETATSLTITATSAADNTKSDKNIVYIKDYFVVDSVEVSPENTTVNTTKTQQFTAKALNDLGSQIAGEQFIWSVSGGTDSTISADGLLSVGTDETAITLTVTATSVTDPTKSDSVQVTVKQQKFQVILWDKGVLYAEYTVAEGKKVAKPTDPTRTGYTFDGWYQDETFTDIWDFENDTVTGNTDLYAKWTPVGSVTQVNHVALTGAPAKYEIGKTVGDYPLTGLSVSTGEVQLAGAMWMATTTATPGMYDLSEPLNGSTLFTAFDSGNPRYFVVTSVVMAKDGFDLSDSMTATVDGAEAIVLVINAGGVKGAYILLPYDPATGNRPDASAPTTYTVTFDSNGGSAVTAQSVQEGQTATEPVAPTKAGYTFMGWTRNKNPYDFYSPVTGNITVYARWGTTYNVSAIPALDSGDSLVDDDLDAYFPASSSYNYLQNTPYWKWYDPSIPNGIAVSGVNYYAYTIMYLEDYSAVPYEGDFVVKYAGTELSKLSSTEIYQDNMKSGYRIYMFDTYNVALQVRIFVGAPIGTDATYNITSGANSVYQKGSAVDKLTFTADGDSSDFLGVEVDGSLIDVGKYDTEVGGTTIIKLRKAYLESLSVGEHTLRIRYHDGAAPTKFTVVEEEPVPADYTIEVSLNGYSLGAKVADAYVSESSDTVDFYDFNDDGTFFCIFEDDGTGQSDWGSTVTQFEADKDYWLVVALTKQGGGALPETGLDADNATLRNGCVDKYSVYDDDLWWIEFKLNRLSESLSGVYNITFDANGGSVTPESATTGSDGKLTDLPIPTHTSPSMAFDGWYTGKTGDIKVTTDTVFTSDTTIYAHWNVDYTIEVTLNGYELGKKVADTTLAESSDSLDLDLENCHIFADEDGEPDWSSEVTEFEAGVEYWLVVALTKQGGEELTSADLSADDVDLTNDHTAELMDYDDDLWWVSYKLKPLEDTTPTFDIWVGGVGMNDGDYLHEGASAVSSAAPTDSSVGYAYYKDGVLTLCNFDYSGEGVYDVDGEECYDGIHYDGDLTIVLKGDNSLAVIADDIYRYGITVFGDLIIEEDAAGGSLAITDSDYGIFADGGLTVNSGTILVKSTTGEEDEDRYALDVFGEFSYDETKLKITVSKDHSGSPEVEYDINDLNEYDYVKLEPISSEEELEPVIIEIPVAKEVKKGGNTDFSGKETFTFEVEVLNSKVEASDLVIEYNTILVTNMNGGNNTLTITVPEDLFDSVCDEGILITEKKGTAQGWTYDETQWIAVYDEETGWKFVPYDELFGDVEPEFQDEVTFTNVYTKNVEEPKQEENKQEESKPSAPAVNPQAPQTGDNSPVALWSSMMVISVLCAAVVVFGKKRFSVR